MNPIYLPGGDRLTVSDEALLVRFAGPRRVLCTAPYNGGIREDLTAVFNHSESRTCEMKADTYAGHLRVFAEELGLAADTAAGISTAAEMDNYGLVSETFRDFTVTALVTGGVDINGGRAGDPAEWHESETGAVYQPGTINIMLFVTANLVPGAMARAAVTAAEAKVTVLEELAAPSRYSRGPATGSGTDSTIIVCDPASPLTLTEAGKQYKLGELIARTVRSALRQALAKQCDMTPERQFNAFRRIDRYLPGSPLEAQIDAPLFKENALVVGTLLLVHLMDQYEWKLIGAADLAAAAAKICGELSVPLPEGFEKGEDPAGALASAWEAEMLRRLGM